MHGPGIKAGTGPLGEGGGQAPHDAGRPAEAERRGCPRLSTRLRARAGGVALQTTNVSMDGMQLSCPGLLMGLLQPSLEGPSLPVTLSLPDGGGDVSVRCSVVYVAHYGYEYLLGLRFIEFQDDGLERLRRHCLDGLEEAAGG